MYYASLHYHVMLQKTDFVSDNWQKQWSGNEIVHDERK